MTIDPHTIEEVRSYGVLELAQTSLKLSGKRRHWNGPCPRCGGTDRFFIDAGKNTFGCRGCGARGQGGIDFVMWFEGLSFTEAVERLGGMSRPAPHEPVDNGDARKHASDLWWHRQPIEGTIGETYLREARGCRGPLSTNLGFLPSWRDRPPCMIAGFGLPGSKVEAVHLTFLKPDGSGKADIEKPKRVHGDPLGKPIVIAPPNDLLGLAVTEGIEDALSVFEATGMGVWAAGSSAYMPALAETVPDYIEEVTIWADDDRAGQRFARALAVALVKRNIETKVVGLWR